MLVKNPPSKFQHSFKYNFILRILFLLHYIIFSQYIYTPWGSNLEGPDFRGTAKILHHEFRTRQLWFDDDHRGRTLLRGFFAPSRAPLDLSGNPTHTRKESSHTRRRIVGLTDLTAVRGYFLHSTFHLNDRKILSRCRLFAKRMLVEPETKPVTGFPRGLISPLRSINPLHLFYTRARPRKMQPVILDRALNETQDVDDSLSKTDNFV